MRNIHLTPQLVQAVRDAADVLDIAGEHTRLTRRGRRHVGLCPLHKEKTPSFSVDPAQGLFYCFGCGAGGDAIKLHMLTTGDDFPGAIETLAQRYGIPLPSRAEGRGAGRPEGPDTQAALEAAAELFADRLAKAAEPRAYLERRKIPRELVERFGLGYAPPGWRDLLEALGGRIPEAALEAAGLVSRSEKGGRLYDRFRHRLMFPIHSPSGRLVGFGGRTLGDDKAKYINTSETGQFHKGRLLYGLHQAKRVVREAGRALLVEGYFDVIGAVASGVDWAVAGMGTSLTPEQARLLARYADEVVVGYDGDEAGETAFRRALPLLLGEGLGVRRARFGAGQDPDSLRLEAGPEAVAAAVEEAADGITLELDRLLPGQGRGAPGSPHQQARLASRVEELLRPIPDDIVRFGYGRLAADRLGIPAEMLWRRGKPGERAARETAPAQGKPEERAGSSGYHPGELPPRPLEHQVLELLFTTEADSLPRPEGLPPAEVFFDPECRNIFRTFCALYTDEEGEPPSAKAVIAALGAGGGGVDRVAKVLLESPSAPSNSGLPALLEKLLRRWESRRLEELKRQIEEAQRQGDMDRCERLVSEKTALSHRHFRPRHGPLSGSS